MDYNKQQYCIRQHTETNHFYDKYLPYEYHLRMVAKIAEEYKHLLDTKENYFGDDKLDRFDHKVTLQESCIIAAWGHDLIEDTRVSYNDVKDKLGQEAAEIIYACTNEKGKNRSEKGNNKYYQGIKDTKGAVYVKLCDRIANVEYSKMSGSRIFDMYKKENPGFLEKIGYTDNHEYVILFYRLINNFV